MEVVIGKRANLLDRLDILLGQEESYGRQRSHVFWLRQGGKNTHFFFHHRAKNRKSKNYSKGLTNQVRA